MKTQLKGQLGVNIVERIVIRDLNARWQAIDGHNDDGVDGLIFLQDAKSHLTGQVIYAQVKFRTKTHIKKSNSYKVNVNNLKNRTKQWKGLIGGCILIYVFAEDEKAYWVNLEDKENVIYSERDNENNQATINISRENEFSGDSREELEKLTGTLAFDHRLPTHRVSRENEVSNLRPIFKTLRREANKIYREIETVNAKDPNLGLVHFTQLGWRHLTAESKSIGKIAQSFLILHSVPQLLMNNGGAKRKRRFKDKFGTRCEHWELTTKVIFPFRDPAIVKTIILKKIYKGRHERSKSWFLSVYESKWGKDLGG